MKRLGLTVAATIACAMASPASAEHHENPALESALASDVRAEDRARDEYRHPAETLAFFDVKPTHTVIEYAPGGGWYTRVLAPYLDGAGAYIAVGLPDAPGVPEGARSTAEWAEGFIAKAGEFGWTSDADFAAFSGSELPEYLDGTVDRVLLIRMMHNMTRWNIVDEQLKALRKTLKDDGMVGIVQHRAKADAPYNYVDGSKGYLREQDVIDRMRLNGFELVGMSPHNANPKDSADWPGGVWTLPPSNGGAKSDPTKGDFYNNIGESDRMTLLFKKAP